MLTEYNQNHACCTEATGHGQANFPQLLVQAGPVLSHVRPCASQTHVAL